MSRGRWSRPNVLPWRKSRSKKRCIITCAARTTVDAVTFDGEPMYRLPSYINHGLADNMPPLPKKPIVDVTCPHVPSHVQFHS